jgi:hypothetical protein
MEIHGVCHFAKHPEQELSAAAHSNVASAAMENKENQPYHRAWSLEPKYYYLIIVSIPSSTPFN